MSNLKASDDPIVWRPLSLREMLKDARSYAPARSLLLAWIALTILCVIAGIYQVKYAWNGIPVNIGTIEFSLTFYPPLVICLWMVFWVGFEWAFITAYLATFTLALYAGIALPAALL